MFCTKCGTKLIDNALFCTSCGAPVKKSSVPVQEQRNVTSQANVRTVVTPQEQPRISNKTEKSKSKKGLIIGLTMLLLILVMAALGLFFIKFKDILAEFDIPFLTQEYDSDSDIDDVNTVKKARKEDNSSDETASKSEIAIDDSSIEAILQSGDLVRYHDEVLIDKYGEIDRDKTYYAFFENYESDSARAYSPSEFEGIFASYIMDYDGDGESELLVILAEDAKEDLDDEVKDAADYVKFTYNIYEAGEEYPSDTLTVSHPCGDGYMVDFNLLSTADNVYITEYEYDDYYLYADGVNYVTCIYHYDGQRFVEDFFHEYGGSDFSDEDAEVARAARTLGSLGFTNTAQSLDYQYKISHENGMVSLGCLLGIWEHQHSSEVSNIYEKLYSASDKAKIAGKVVYNIYPSYESYEHEQYILPMSSERLLTEVDLAGLTKDELRIARNELYARHGRLFDSEDLQNYFDKKSWYRGTVPAKEFTDDWLTDVEKKNKDAIVNYEKKMGFR